MEPSGTSRAHPALRYRSIFLHLSLFSGTLFKLGWFPIYDNPFLLSSINHFSFRAILLSQLSQSFLPSDVRVFPHPSISNVTTFLGGGWHFTNFGGVDMILQVTVQCSPIGLFLVKHDFLCTKVDKHPDFRKWTRSVIQNTRFEVHAHVFFVASLINWAC
jgi:hypothetical protein